jgi:predicted dehydrogenase
MTPRSIELIGCGALAESVYAPVLAHLEHMGRVRVTALVDPNAARTAQIGKSFPMARQFARVEDLPAADGSLAVIASPPGVHSAQACALLAAGRHVLCEKPLATSVAEAQSMIAAAQQAARLLAAGMMRRFYPAAQALRENLAAGWLGALTRIEIAEGGRFAWNAASPHFFDPANGGVLYDLGSHTLDLLCHFFGEPTESAAWTDALGGTNTNCLLTARWSTRLEARVRLSWDTALETGWHMQGERGECRWDGSADGSLIFRMKDAKWWLHAQAQTTPQPGATPGWTAAFVRQFDNVLAAIDGKEKLLAPAADVLPSLRWLETARHEARRLPQPWLSPEELAGAARLVQS